MTEVGAVDVVGGIVVGVVGVVTDVTDCYKCKCKC